MDLNGGLNSERFRLRNGMHSDCELQPDFNERWGKAFASQVLDRLEPAEGTAHPGSKRKALEELWLEKQSLFGGRGYHRERG